MIASTGKVRVHLELVAEIDGRMTDDPYPSRVEYLVEAWDDDGHPLVPAKPGAGLQRVESIRMYGLNGQPFRVRSWDYIHIR